MSLAPQDVRRLIDIYLQAWTTHLEFEGDRVASLREYWASERVSS